MNTQTATPCADDPEVFYTLTARNIEKSKALCATCIQSDDCLSLAMKAEAGEPLAYRFGIFGGKTPEERFALSL
jgi:WhiB family redox-sensing transcriptional regulator